MTFTPKVWRDAPAKASPLQASALIDLETRLAAYTDAVSNSGTALLQTVLSAPTVISGNVVNTGRVLLGTGDNQDVFTHIPTVAGTFGVNIGTASTPDVSQNPPVKITRTSAIPASSVYGDGAEETAAILGITVGTAAAQTQTVGVMAVAQNYGTAGGTNQAGKSITPDTVGLYAVSEIDASGIGASIGTFIESNGFSPATKAINPVQIYMNNSTGTDSTVVPNGQAVARSIAMYNNGPNLSGVGIEFVGPTQGGPGSLWDVGLHFPGTQINNISSNTGVVTGTNTLTDTGKPAVFHSWDVGETIVVGGISTQVATVVSATQLTTTTPIVNGTGVTYTYSPNWGGIQTAAYQDDSFGLWSILVKGAHDKAAIAVDAGAGSVVIGELFTTSSTALLEVRGPDSAANPLAIFGNGSHTQPYSLQMRNSAGTGYLAISHTSNFIVTGTTAGDLVLTSKIGGTFTHMGGTKSVVKVGADDTLGFYNVTSVAQPTAAGTTAGFSAATGATVVSGSTFTGNTGTTAYTLGDVVRALKLLGLLNG